MKPIAILTLLVCVFSVSIGRAQQAAGGMTPLKTDNTGSQLQPGHTLYDGFDHKWLDPARWIAGNGAVPYTEACYYSSNVLECVREIQNGKLRLAVRSNGATDSNEGTQYGESKIIFTQPFVGITADVVVRATNSVGCPANTTEPWAQAMFTARFFNSGSRDPNDDVDAHLTFAHGAQSNPGVLDVEAFLFWQGQYFGFTKVGNVQAGTPVRATLRWIPSQHKFTAGFENLTTHQHFSANVPYSIPDTTPPTGYWNALYVQVFPANCIDQQTSSQIEAVFDNVQLDY